MKLKNLILSLVLVVLLCFCLAESNPINSALEENVSTGEATKAGLKSSTTNVSTLNKTRDKVTVDPKSLLAKDTTNDTIEVKETEESEQTPTDIQGSTSNNINSNQSILTSTQNKSTSNQNQTNGPSQDQELKTSTGISTLKLETSDSSNKSTSASNNSSSEGNLQINPLKPTVVETKLPSENTDTPSSPNTSNKTGPSNVPEVTVGLDKNTAVNATNKDETVLSNTLKGITTSSLTTSKVSQPIANGDAIQGSEESKIKNSNQPNPPNPPTKPVGESSQTETTSNSNNPSSNTQAGKTTNTTPKQESTPLENGEVKEPQINETLPQTQTTKENPTPSKNVEEKTLTPPKDIYNTDYGFANDKTDEKPANEGPSYADYEGKMQESSSFDYTLRSSSSLDKEYQNAIENVEQKIPEANEIEDDHDNDIIIGETAENNNMSKF